MFLECGMRRLFDTGKFVLVEPVRSEVHLSGLLIRELLNAPFSRLAEGAFGEGAAPNLARGRELAPVLEGLRKVECARLSR